MPGPGAVEVQLRLGPDAGWVPESVPVRAVVRDGDGAVTGVVLDVSGMAWFERLLLQLGPAARVVSPPLVDGAGRRRGPAGAGPLLGSGPWERRDFNAGRHRRVPGEPGQGGRLRRRAGRPAHHHGGASRGKERVNPLVALARRATGSTWSPPRAGAPTNPDWYYNLVAHPEVGVELGDGALRCRRRRRSPGPSATASSRRRWPYQPGFAEYAEKTAGDRVIPVVELRRS